MCGRVRVAAGTAFLAVSLAIPGFALARAGELRLPTGTPPYVAAAVTQYAMTPGNSDVTVVLVRLGRFPLVVVKGMLVCGGCSEPAGAHANFGPRPAFADLSFDAVSQRKTGFGFGPTEAGVLNNWCGAGNCGSRQTVALESADDALNTLSDGDGEIYGLNIGTWQCEVTPGDENTGIVGTCDTTLSLGTHATVLTFREEWNGLDPDGRRYAADSPTHRHVYRVTVALNGYVDEVQSSGDALPKAPAVELPAFPPNPEQIAEDTYLGMSQIQILTQLQAGKSLAEIADSEGDGKNAAGLIEAILHAIYARDEQRVADGMLNASQIKTIESDQAIAETNLVNRGHQA